MPALFTNTSNRQIISRSEASALSVSAAMPHQHHPIDGDGDRLLNPHEIAILMVPRQGAAAPAGRPRRPALPSRSRSRSTGCSIACRGACLSADGRQMVSRLARRDCAGQGRNVDVTTAFRAIVAERSVAIAHHAAR